MYKLLLILKYLGRKITPMVAALAVTLCTAMVIIVIGIMGGFLELMRHSAKKLTGEVMIRGGMSGFPHHAAILEGLQTLPQVEGVSAIIRAYGLIKLHGHVSPVEVLGIDSHNLDTVTGHRATLYWSDQHLRERLERQLAPIASEQRKQFDAQGQALLDLHLHRSMNFDPPPAWQPADSPALPGIVLGIEVNPYNTRDEQGQYSLDIYNHSLSAEIVLTVLRVDQQGAPSNPAYQLFIVVNEFKSGLYEIDANRVYVPFALLQKMLRMDAVELFDDDDEPTGQIDPARASEIMIKGKPGVSLEALHAAVRRFTEQFALDHSDMPSLFVETWEQRHKTLLHAVEKEKGLLVFLFGFISLVAVAMIAAIFYMIVLAKTRDIGTLRALGASRRGIAAIFLGYGFAIGAVGSGLGLALAAAIVLNINQIQDMLHDLTGFRMWDPKVYYFDRVPGQLDPIEVTVIIVTAVLSSLLGSLLPALRAARVDPVESLRYE